MPSVFRLVLANEHQQLRGQEKEGRVFLPSLHSLCPVATAPVSWRCFRRPVCCSRSISCSLGPLCPGVEGTSCRCWDFMLRWPCPVRSPCPQLRPPSTPNSALEQVICFPGPPPTSRGGGGAQGDYLFAPNTLVVVDFISSQESGIHFVFTGALPIFPGHSVCSSRTGQACPFSVEVLASVLSAVCY